LAVEHNFRKDLRGTVSLFSYKIDDLITLTTLPSTEIGFINQSMKAQGLELEAEQIWNSDRQLKASISWQKAEDSDSGEWIDNSPRRLAKINYTTRVLSNEARLGLEILAISSRLNSFGNSVSGCGISNLTLGSEKVVTNLEITASIYDLFDRQCDDPASDGNYDSLERYLDVIRQDGRTYRLNATYKF